MVRYWGLCVVLLFNDTKILMPVIHMAMVAITIMVCDIMEVGNWVYIVVDIVVINMVNMVLYTEMNADSVLLITILRRRVKVILTIIYSM